VVFVRNISFKNHGVAFSEILLRLLPNGKRNLSTHDDEAFECTRYMRLGIYGVTRRYGQFIKLDKPLGIIRK